MQRSLYTDLGCKDLRQEFLNKAKWDWLFGFINWELIFNIYYRFKFAAVVVEKRHAPSTHEISSAFGRYNIVDWEQAESVSFPLPRDNVLEFSPKTLSVLEIADERDLKIIRCIYDHSIRIGDRVPGWEVDYAREFDMTNDSKHFPTIDKWKAKGFESDEFGRWKNSDGEIALPLYEGRMISMFDFSNKGWVQGRGRSAEWRELPFDAKTIEPQYLIAQSKYDSWEGKVHGVRLGFMAIGSSTNSRTGVACMLPEVPCGNSVSTLRVAHGNLPKTLYLAGAVSSFAFDFAFRARVGGINLNWFILEESAIPIDADESLSDLVILNTARLTMLHRRFAPEWQSLREFFSQLNECEWKHWWAVSAADRLRLHLQIDAACAALYGLTPDDMDWMLRLDESDPKGFWRVDNVAAFTTEERMTSLVTKAFRALKEGKWSAETVGQLSNDEFFDLLGIPELTNAKAAEAKGLSGPLILKRDGCHSWQPENFPKDDPRHGWTWDDCRNDAITLLGSEEALEEYITQATATGEEADDEDEEPHPNRSGPKDLFGNPVPTDLFGNELRPKKKRRL